MKFSLSEILNDAVSGMGRSIDFVFDSMCGFGGRHGDGGTNEATSGWTKSKMVAGCHLENFR